MTLWRRFKLALLRPLLASLARRLEIEDPWQREFGSITVALAGTGARHDFAWYFEGQSRVKVRSLEDVQDWLDTCEPTRDAQLFRERDYWQHPLTFEQLQRGDCEDFALWAWRKLVELGYDADFVGGRRLQVDEGVSSIPSSSRHAWVMFRRDGDEFVYEPQVRNRTRALRPLDEVRQNYLPEFGVGRTRRPFLFGGFYVGLRDRTLGYDVHPVGG